GLHPRPAFANVFPEARRHNSYSLTPNSAIIPSNDVQRGEGYRPPTQILQGSMVFRGNSGRHLVGVAIVATGLVVNGCRHPSLTAVPLSPWNQGEPCGIPFYMPKPLLVISKNFRYIEEAKVGLTTPAPIPGGFDDQSKYADLNARTNFSDTAGAG